MSASTPRKKVPEVSSTSSPNKNELEEDITPVKKTVSKEEKIQKYLTDYIIIIFSIP